MISVAQLAHLLFDSSRTPALAGVRSSTQSSRQIMVEAEPFVIDLQFESDSARQRISLTGQIFNSRKLQTAIDGADVVLLSVDNLVRKTKTNELGEFCLDFSREENLRLFVNIRGKRAIGIVLPDLDSSETKVGR